MGCIKDTLYKREYSQHISFKLGLCHHHRVKSLRWSNFRSLIWHSKHDECGYLYLYLRSVCAYVCVQNAISTIIIYVKHWTCLFGICDALIGENTDQCRGWLHTKHVSFDKIVSLRKFAISYGSQYACYI